VKYQVLKKFRFEAAHRMVKAYEGKCNNNHGHSWEVIIILEGGKLDKRDMLIDFNELKALGRWIDDNLDHSTILWEKDHLADYLKKDKNRIFLTKKNPTSEHLAEVILKKAIELFKNKKTIRVAGIEVGETCTAAAKIFI